MQHVFKRHRGLWRHLYKSLNQQHNRFIFRYSSEVPENLSDNCWLHNDQSFNSKTAHSSSDRIVLDRREIYLRFFKKSWTVVSHRKTLQLGWQWWAKSGEAAFNLQLNPQCVINLKGGINQAAVGCRAGPPGGINTRSHIEIQLWSGAFGELRD